jgi:hypothetical protein
MSSEVLAAALKRHHDRGAVRLVQFSRVDDGFEHVTSPVRVEDLPPVASLAEEQAS